MFHFEDLPKFFLAFFMVMPLISILHEAGHVFFAWLMGAKNIRVIVGTGKSVLKLGMLEIRKYYFWYGLCTFENIERKEKISNLFIFAGGAFFNLLGILTVILLVNNKIIEPGQVTYQFTYFSWYFIFFALLPMTFPDGNYSDGKIILDLLRGRKSIIQEKTYRIHPNSEKNFWQVLDEKGQCFHKCTKEEEALETARKIAENNRPSRIISQIDGKEKEIQNYPRIPL